MITGLIVGLVVGAALGVVAGLLVRSDQLGTARTAEARLVDANERNQALAAELQQVRAQLAEDARRTVAHEADLARLSTELDHERQAAAQRTEAFEDTRRQLTGEFARLSSLALQQNNEQ